MDEFINLLLSFITFLFIVIASVIVLLIVAFVVKMILSRVAYKESVKKRIKNNELSYLFIKIPSSNEKKEDAMMVFLHSLHRVIPNNTYVSLEMVSHNQFLRFYIVVPKQYKGIVESQLYAQYPEAEVEETEDYLPAFDKNTAFGELSFKHASIHPIKTFQEMEEDLLKTISSVLANTSASEQVYFQITLKRIGSKFWHRGFKATQYKMFNKDLGETPRPATAKLSQDLFLGSMKIAYVSSDTYSAKSQLVAFAGNFKSLKGSHNELKLKKRAYSPILVESMKARQFPNGHLLHVAEIATLYHFPYKGSVVSNIVHTSSKRAPAPDILPREGLVDPSQVSFIGETNYRNEHFKFGLKRFDRRRHVYVVGKTGSGKSRMLELLLISDIQNGQGCCLLDPHGDLADELLKYIPKE